VADAELLFNVPPGAFIPAPQVMSSVIQLKFFPRARFQVEDRPLFAELIYHVFKQRRKMLKNSIGGLPWIQSQWQKVEFDFTRRPEELPLDDFVELFSLLKPMSRKD
jgi:16S rRNA (adenine1518-N6/adenine1519-N6)-dimethyltransferase